MITHNVKSSNISTIGYDAIRRTLRVTFKGGVSYDYSKVSKELYTKFLGAESIGKFLAQNIKGKFEYKKVVIKKKLLKGQIHFLKISHTNRFGASPVESEDTITVPIEE